MVVGTITSNCASLSGVGGDGDGVGGNKFKLSRYGYIVIWHGELVLGSNSHRNSFIACLMYL